MSWMTNTCAIRTTLAMRAIGIEMGDIANARWKDKERRKYLIRVKEVNAYMHAAFGPPTWVGGAGRDTGRRDQWGEKIYENPASIMGKAGLIRYSDCPFSDASGHFDVWDGKHDRGHGYPMKCNKKEVWDLCNPKQSPNFDALWAHMKATKGWDPRGRPAVASSTTPRAEAASSGSAPDLRRAQTLLNELSGRLNDPLLHVGKADGIMGRKTRGGLNRFQELKGLPVTGRLDAKTWKELSAGTAQG